MDKPRVRIGALGIAAAVLIAPMPGAAIAPVLLMMVRQAGSSMFKDMLLGSVRDSGCKGAALADALQGFDVRSALTGAGAARVGLSGMPGQSLTAPGGVPGAGAGMPDMAAMKGMLGGMMPAGRALPPGMALAPEQAAMFAQLQQSMAQPLSPGETLATIDELGEIGLVPAPMLAELKECLVLQPQASAGMGMGMGMLRPMLGQLRSAREQMRALPPEEQDELAARMAEQLRDAPADERRQFLESMGGGFLPPRVADGVRSRLGSR